DRPTETPGSGPAPSAGLLPRSAAEGRAKGSRATKFTWHGIAFSAVSSYSVPEITALKPSISPAPAIFRMSTLPSPELVETFTLPEHNRKTPRGVWPSTNNVASEGYVVCG